MKRLFFIMGLPGSGKTTLAHQIREIIHCKKFEADDFFIDPKTGQYCFDRDYLPQAHALCQKYAMIEMEQGRDLIVSNTSLRAWEREPYFDMCRIFGYDLIIIVMKNKFKNTHKVSEEKILDMKSKFEPIEATEIESIKTVRCFTSEEKLINYLKGN